MVVDTLNGLTKKNIPYEGQIIRVADEYDAIVSKRQYKSHINISDTLGILIENTVPKVPQKLGKNNPKIVKALFKVVIDNIEYEIYCTNNYINDLKAEIKRCSEIEKYIEKMNLAKNDEYKAYYLETINFLLKPNEKLELFKTLKQEYIYACETRKTIIDNLYLEIKKIKKLRHTF